MRRDLNLPVLAILQTTKKPPLCRKYHALFWKQLFPRPFYPLCRESFPLLLHPVRIFFAVPWLGPPRLLSTTYCPAPCGAGLSNRIGFAAHVQKSLLTPPTP
jgi:hypothetical protein